MERSLLDGMAGSREALICYFCGLFSHCIGLLGLFLGQGSNREKEVGNVVIGGVGLRDDG